MDIHKTGSALICVAVLFFASCASKPPKTELQRVAKDWCLTIRASQVMPMYPLEEDLRPGDVYLINHSIDSEIESWNSKGFLPMVNRFARIPIEKTEYDTYFTHFSGAPPQPSFERHPKAAFPSYSFSVDKRGSLGLAIPLSSVPVALSMSGARSATGSVVLSGASTIGLPDMVMDIKIKQWASDETIKAFLKDKVQESDNPLLLRAITRVFSITSATVSLTFEQAGGIGVQAGAPPATPDLLSTSEADFDKRIEQLNKEIELQKTLDEAEPVEMPTDSTGETGMDPQIAALEKELREVKQLKTMNEIQALRRNVERSSMLDQFGGYILPGASVRVAGRTARGISMEEIFPKPLVVGYWATEYLVYEDGTLLSLGGINHLVNHPDEYQRRIVAARELAAQVTKNGKVFKPGETPF